MQTLQAQNQISLCHGIKHLDDILVATQPIPAGVPVLAYSGSLIESAEALRHQNQKILRIEENLYLFLENADSIFPAHNCTPNLGLSGQQTFISLRAIKPGEKLSFDYAMAGMELGLCSCQSKSCRKKVSASDINDPILYSRYHDHLSPFMARNLRIDGPDRFLMQFEATGAWGLATALDLYECNPDTIRSYDKIYEYTIALCKEIKVNRYGDPVIVHFGQDERVSGYSLVQLIETSLVSGHFANQTNHAYLDIFSCAYYDPARVARFSKEFFGAQSFHTSTVLRR
jgi:S-adenosylmethionine/arginine decarboxylase-like enzyme